MRYISDLHVHSRFSRACSDKLNIKNMEKWARIKGVNLLGTGDFTHPKWIKELKNNLVENDSGILKTSSGYPFVLQTEISLIYTQAGQGRKIHNVVLAPSFEVVDQITEYLKTHGRVDYDGRPIFKIPAHEFVYNLRKISYDIEVIPAHIWTPWFSMFGSKSGFDSVHECFKDQEKHIHALETGLSSDPPMNWRLSQLDRYNLVSSSDLHSFWPWRTGREATMLELKELNYTNLLRALRIGQGLKGTIEVDPSYGKYHYDGHRKCNVVMTPEESLKNNNICPKCGNELTLGVAHRVEELADRPKGYKPKNAKEFYKMLPLSEILSRMLDFNISTKTVWRHYNQLMKHFKSEYEILLDASEEKLLEVTHPKIVRAIIKNRQGEMEVKPGYDGVYGELQLETIQEKELEKEEKKAPKGQKGLSDFLN